MSTAPMSSLKPIEVYVHPGGGPNPYKVLIILEELGLPYTKIPITDPKSPTFLLVNPNGRLPAIVDPNFSSSSSSEQPLTLWESGAIVEYLADVYDNNNNNNNNGTPKISSSNEAEKWHLKQYLHFQMSGQGPYYGQAVFFQKCPQDVPVAKERYIEQMVRVVGVLEDILASKEEGKKRWLVGGRMTYADLSFVPWNIVMLGAPFFKESVVERYAFEDKYPRFMAWHRAMVELPSVKAAYS